LDEECLASYEASHYEIFSSLLSTSAAQYQNPEFVFFPLGGKRRFTPMQKFDMDTVMYILNFTF
jgi:hypothetical protein